MRYRKARSNDLDLLAEWNYQLISDEGHQNPMGVSELRERMKKWIKSEYKAIIFSNEDDIAYALFKENKTEIYLRQFFVRRDRRREGMGREAMGILFKQVWPKDKRLTLDVLIKNKIGIEFWRSIGYQDYYLSLEILPKQT